MNESRQIQENIHRMRQFAEVYPDEEIVVSLIRQLSWTHLIALIPMSDPIKHDFYTQMCILERWSVRQLRDRINSMLFEMNIGQTELLTGKIRLCNLR